jgi:hypothetical protein
MAMGVGILVVAQAGVSPGDVRPKAAVTGIDTDHAPAMEVPGTPASTDATLRFRNDVGDTFDLLGARFALDGRDLPALLTSAEHGQDYVIFAGPIAPGRHVLTSHITYKSRSRSIFTYMNGYTFNLDTVHELVAPDSGAMTATVVGKRDKGFNVPFERSLVLGLEKPVVPAGNETGARAASTGAGGAR